MIYECSSDLYLTASIKINTIKVYNKKYVPPIYLLVVLR